MCQVFAPADLTIKKGGSHPFSSINIDYELRRLSKNLKLEAYGVKEKGDSHPYCKTNGDFVSNTTKLKLLWAMEASVEWMNSGGAGLDGRGGIFNNISG